MRTMLPRRLSTLPLSGHQVAGTGLGDQHRDPVLAVALARLEVACLHRDDAAAARVLDDLQHDDDGAWLLVQMASAGFRHLAVAAQHGAHR